METHLYRHFDDAGKLLYVGISLNAAARLSQHMRAARWKGRIARVEIETHPSRTAALRAEAEAIVAERPPFNIQGTKRRRPNKPKHVDRIEVDDNGYPALIHGPVALTHDGGWHFLQDRGPGQQRLVNSCIIEELLEIAGEWFAKWMLTNEAKELIGSQEAAAQDAA